MSSLTDDEIRIQVLRILYKEARERPSGHRRLFRGVDIIQNILNVDLNVLEFNMEYLGEKGLIELELGEDAEITAFGIDVVERILLLEKESKKPKPDQGKIDRAVQWLKDNANTIIPILVDLGLKIPHTS